MFLRMDSSSSDGLLVSNSGMCIVVDAVERRLRITGKERENPNHLVLLLLTTEQLATFGVRVMEKDLHDDDYIYCDSCNTYYHSSCYLHPLFLVPDKKALEESKPRDEQTLPTFLEISSSKIPKAGLGIFSKVDVPVGFVFGPYQGLLLASAKEADEHGYTWELFTEGKPSRFIDGSDRYYSNWMRFVNNSRNRSEQNLTAFQYNGGIYYRVSRPINEGDELLVWYGKKYRYILGVLNVKQRPTKHLR